MLPVSRRFNESQLDEIAARYRAGETREQIAKAYGASITAVVTALRARRVRMRAGCNPLGRHSHRTTLTERIE